MPTRFKYTRSKPTAFGLTPAEILLATDKELDAIAGLRHIAPYRKQGLGMQGRGISKRIYDLKQKLKERKWGEEMEADEDGKTRTMSRDAGWSGKRKASGEDKDEGGEGTRKKKRLGKSQRKREREAKGWVAPEGGEGASTATPSVNRFEAPEQPKQAEEVVMTATGDGEKEGKKRRKKKSSQKQEELKIFD
jgi:protein KRI1